MLGAKDLPTVTEYGETIRNPSSSIAGVQYIKLNNILCRSGLVTEVFRSPWFNDVKDEQINWVELSPNGVTDWHCHFKQDDRLVGLNGIIKLCLYDGRPDSPTRGNSELFRLAITSPGLVVVPKGVWHGLRNESGQPAGFLNVIDQLFDHNNPDNFRLPFDAAEIPITL